MTDNNLKTFIKWQGNKSNHVRFLLPLIPKKYNTYIEPFLGSGALLTNRILRFIKNKKNDYFIHKLTINYLCCY